MSVRQIYNVAISESFDIQSNYDKLAILWTNGKCLLPEGEPLTFSSKDEQSLHF